MATVSAALVAWRLWPSGRRQRRPFATTVAAVVGAYLAVSVGSHAGFNAWLDDEIIDKATKAEVDGTDVWFIASIVSLVVLGLERLRRRSR